jgi:benzoyl-CoA reductase subunit C
MDLFNEEITERYRQNGKKLVGCLSSDVPEELIHAAGMLPVRLFGRIENVEKAHGYIPSWCCIHSRRCLEEALNGRFKWIDGIVSSKFDDTCVQLYSLLKHVIKPKFYYLIQTPILRTDLSKEFLINNLLEFKEKLETFTGKTISDQDLRNSIKVYNKNRQLLKKLYETRKQKNPPINGPEILKEVILSMTIPKEEHNKKLQEILHKIELVEEVTKKVRVHVSGTEVYDPEILQIIEDCGASVVSDDLDTGSRYFWFEVEENKDPYEAIAEAYLFKKVTNMHVVGQFSDSVTERVEYMCSLIKEFRADGVIFLIDRGCETFGHVYPHLRDKLKELDIPYLRLDLDVPFSREYYRTRVEAFVEMLRG